MIPILPQAGAPKLTSIQFAKILWRTSSIRIRHHQSKHDKMHIDTTDILSKCLAGDEVSDVPIKADRW